MKKLFLLALAALALAACNDDKDDAPRFAAENTRIENGSLTGTNLHFLGTSTSVSADGDAYVDRSARTEIAGGSDNLAFYMQGMRFAAKMPALKIRLHDVAYTPGEGAALSFELDEIVPDAYLPNKEGGGYSYQPLPSYTLTGVSGSVIGTTCRLSFSCDVPRLGAYRVEYEGKLLE